MKKNFTILSYIMIAFALVFTSCKKDDDVSPEQQALNALSGTWTINSGTASNDNITLSGVTINFNSENLTYTLSGLNVMEDLNLNHAGVFEGSGDFELNSNQTAIIFSTGETVNYSISDNTLTLTYQSNYPKASDTAKSITLTATK